MGELHPSQIKVKVVGTGGAGGNAVLRMAKRGLQGVDFLALNTDVQALRQIKGVRTLAIGPRTTGGLGSGGNPEVGRKAIKESQEQVTQLVEGSDMVFVTAGLGGGTGTGSACVVADIARRHGALTVGVATLPFSFEGPHRRKVALEGLRQLGQKVDTLIAVENDRLLPALKGKVSLDKAFQMADEVLSQGVQGISDIITVPGLINVDFADVKSVMTNGGPAFMAIGEGRGKSATLDAANLALSNPLFDAPVEGATGILLNVKGGMDLTLEQVNEAAAIVRKASKSQADVIFGVVQDRRLNKRVSITLVATGLVGVHHTGDEADSVGGTPAAPGTDALETAGITPTNGHRSQEDMRAHRLL